MDERANLPSASGLERLAFCPGSFALEQACPPEPESAEATSGTRIHAALARFYATNRNPEADSLTAAEAETFNMCATVADRLCESWIDVESGPPAHKLEEREWLHAGLDEVMSGQYDVFLKQGRRGLVIDYKTGHGDQAESAGNLQLRALAVILAEAENVSVVTVAIIQPWVSMKPQTCLYLQEDLDQARREILAILQAAKAPDAPLVPGDKQCRFCRAKATCPALNEQVERFGSLALATIQDSDLPRLLEVCGAVDRAVATIRARAKHLLEENPDALPGWTLEEGATRRSIRDPRAAFSQLSNVVTAEEFAGCCTVKIGELERAFTSTMKAKTGLKLGECRNQFEHLLAGNLEKKASAAQLARAKPALPAAA